MPYVVVSKNQKQARDIIVAAGSWIKTTDDGKSFVYLPKAAYEKVKEMLENDTPPLADWEQHECDILIRNIPTLASAYKALDMVRKRGLLLREDSLEAQFGLPVAQKRLKIDTTGNGQGKEIPVTVYESLTNDEDGQDMFLFSDADHVKDDPFGDVVPPLEQPLPVLSSVLPVKPSLPVVDKTKAKPNEPTVSCINVMMQAEQDPLGDVPTPSLPPKTIIVHIPPKPTLPAVPKPIVVSVPDQISTRSSSTARVPKTPLPVQIPKQISVVVHNTTPDKNNYITGKVVGSKVASGNVINTTISKVAGGNVMNTTATSGNVIASVAQPNVAKPSKKNDENQSPLLQNLLYELKSMIITNQAEIKRQVCEGFKQMQHSLMMLMEQQRLESGCQNPDCAGKNRFTFNTLTSIEDLKRFEQQLKDVEYRTKLHSWILSKVQLESDRYKRMNTMFNLMFAKPLHVQLNWSGKFGKEGLRTYVNLTELFRFIGTTSEYEASMEEVASFFKQNVDYFTPENETHRASVSSTKATEPLKLPTVQLVSTNSNTLASGGCLSETGDTMDTSDAECTSEPNEGVKNRDEESNQSSSEGAGTSSGGSQRTKPANTFITSMDKMDRFEKQLSDQKIKQQVHKWVDKTFGSEANVEKRLTLMLNRLMDVKVFQHFKWKMPACGQRRLVEYPNFIELFEHASRTVEGDKTVIHSDLVATFFQKRLTYAQQRKLQYKLSKTNDHTFKLAHKEKTWNDPE